MHMTKVHYSIDNIKKLMSVLRYVDETLFERKYERISHMIRIFYSEFSSQGFNAFLKSGLWMFQL
jgi:uncharacterized protein YqgV (UPF0045/DUF77 family)